MAQNGLPYSAQDVSRPADLSRGLCHTAYLGEERRRSDSACSWHSQDKLSMCVSPLLLKALLSVSSALPILNAPQLHVCQSAHFTGARACWTFAAVLAVQYHVVTGARRCESQIINSRDPNVSFVIKRIWHGLGREGVFLGKLSTGKGWIQLGEERVPRLPRYTGQWSFALFKFDRQTGLGLQAPLLCGGLPQLT